jgi:uncharacterized protein with HEPN domain
MTQKTVYLFHIRDAIEYINQFVVGGVDSIINDVKTKFAVERAFEIIGEASAKLPEDLKKKYPDVEWQKIKAFRNKLSHDYFDIDYDAVIDIIKNKLPVLQKQIIQIINETQK